MIQPLNSLSLDNCALGGQSREFSRPLAAGSRGLGLDAIKMLIPPPRLALLMVDLVFQRGKGATLTHLARHVSCGVACRYFDFDRLKEVTQAVAKNLNKIIDVNFYPVDHSKALQHAAQAHRYWHSGELPAAQKQIQILPHPLPLPLPHHCKISGYFWLGVQTQLGGIWACCVHSLPRCT